MSIVYPVQTILRHEHAAASIYAQKSVSRWFVRAHWCNERPIIEYSDVARPLNEFVRFAVSRSRLSNLEAATQKRSCVSMAVLKT